MSKSSKGYIDMRLKRHLSSC